MAPYRAGVIDAYSITRIMDAQAVVTLLVLITNTWSSSKGGQRLWQPGQHLPNDINLNCLCLSLFRTHYSFAGQHTHTGTHTLKHTHIRLLVHTHKVATVWRK